MLTKAVEVVTMDNIILNTINDLMYSRWQCALEVIAICPKGKEEEEGLSALWL